MHVSGRVRRGGRPLADLSLAFHALGDPGTDEADWDSTDENGRYEVRIPPANYRVLDDDHGAFLVSVSVPSGTRAHVLDIELPAGPFW